MSERWKYQIKFVFFWSIFMTVFHMLFELRKHSIMEQISNSDFYYRAISMTIVGFIVSYFNWKSTKKPVK